MFYKRQKIFFNYSSLDIYRPLSVIVQKTQRRHVHEINDKLTFSLLENLYQSNSYNASWTFCKQVYDKMYFYLILKWLQIVKFTIALRNKRTDGKHDRLHEARPVNVESYGM